MISPFPLLPSGSWRENKFISRKVAKCAKGVCFTHRPQRAKTYVRKVLDYDNEHPPSLFELRLGSTSRSPPFAKATEGRPYCLLTANLAITDNPPPRLPFTDPRLLLTTYYSDHRSPITSSTLTSPPYCIRFRRSCIVFGLCSARLAPLSFWQP